MDGRREKSGFTLLELLVVIAIIALLIGILVPSLASARQVARSTACASNVRQMMTAVLGYAYDFEDVLPSASSYNSSSQASWFYDLGEYLTTDVSTLARCPDDRSELWEQAHQPSGFFRRSSYATNFFLSGRLTQFEMYRKLSAIQRPVQTVLPAELAEEGEYATSDHYHPELWLVDPANEAGEQLSLTRHLGKSNWGHLDGHVETLGLDAVYQLDPESRLGNIIWIANRLNPEVSK